MKFIAQCLKVLFHSIRPLLGPAYCPFEPSCGHYAMQQLEDQSLLIALRNICKRVLSCNPLSQWLSYQKLR